VVSEPPTPLCVRLVDRFPFVEHFDPHPFRRPFLARSLLVERLRLDSVGKALHHERAIVDGRQQDG